MIDAIKTGVNKTKPVRPFLTYCLNTVYLSLPPQQHSALTKIIMQLTSYVSTWETTAFVHSISRVRATMIPTKNGTHTNDLSTVWANITHCIAVPT